MRIKSSTAGLAAAGLLAATGLSLGLAAPASANGCPHPDNGYMCVRVHNVDTGAWTWLGPWYACTTHKIPLQDMVTWVEDNQYSGTKSWFYGVGGYLVGTMTAKVNARPPGYYSSDASATDTITVC